MRQLVSLDLQAGRPANALAWVDRILAVDPGDPWALTLRATLKAPLP